MICTNKGSDDVDCLSEPVGPDRVLEGERAAATLLEGAGYTNNVITSSSFTFPFLLPDLAPALTNGPNYNSVHTTGTEVTLSFYVQNTGTAALTGATYWVDGVVLLSLQTGQVLATLASEPGDPTETGQGYHRTMRVTIPAFCFGAVALSVVADVEGSVEELSERNNGAVVPIVCEPAPSADLIGVSADATEVEPGLLKLTWVVRNAGQTLTGLHRWQDQCSLRTHVNSDDNGNIQELRYLVGTFSFELPLVAGASWTNVRYAPIPHYVPLGIFSFDCQLDSGETLFEIGGEENNVVQSNATLQLSERIVGNGWGG
jgi:hypothetical protein